MASTVENLKGLGGNAGLIFFMIVLLCYRQAVTGLVLE